MTRHFQATGTLPALPKRFWLSALMALAALVPGAAERSHADVTMTFEGLHDLEPVLDYYDGGSGGTNWFAQMWPTSKTDANGQNIHDYNPATGGPNYGISFSDNALAVISGAGGIGDFSNNPSGDTVALIAPFDDSFGNAGVTMTIWAGWSNSTFSFYYSGLSTPGTIVSIYDAVGGPSGTGSVIASEALPDTQGDSDNVWTEFSLPFTGTAYSIYFSAPIGADNVSLSGISIPADPLNQENAVQPVPETSAIAIWSVLLSVGIAWFSREKTASL
ncbi:MAG TPA: hypothetical protein VGN12_21650 [Pirellulales bacterium]